MKNSGSCLMLDAVTATGAGGLMPWERDTVKSFHAVGTTSVGVGAATILIEASSKITPVTSTSVDWVTLGTITLTLGTTQTGDGFIAFGGWKHVRANVSAISGTGATVSVWIGG